MSSHEKQWGTLCSCTDVYICRSVKRRMIRINVNVKSNFMVRARLLMGLAGWLGIGRMKRRIEVVGSRRNSQAPQRGTVQPAAVLTSMMGYPSTTKGKHMEMTATDADPEGSPPHQFSLELKGTSHWHFRKAQLCERNRPGGKTRSSSMRRWPREKLLLTLVSVSLCSKWG